MRLHCCQLMHDSCPLQSLTDNDCFDVCAHDCCHCHCCRCHSYCWQNYWHQYQTIANYIVNSLVRCCSMTLMLVSDHIPLPMDNWCDVVAAAAAVAVVVVDAVVATLDSVATIVNCRFVPEIASWFGQFEPYAVAAVVAVVARWDLKTLYTIYFF